MKIKNGILIKSCWKLNKTGTMQVMKTKQLEWEERISTLKDQIQYWIENPTEKTIEIIQLFY
jgi:Holliday junction resolvasome RuvABC endonuclease subunit